MKRKLVRGFLMCVMAGVVSFTSLCGGVNVYAADAVSAQAETDFLTKYGLEVTPNGKVTIPAAVCKSSDPVAGSFYSMLDYSDVVENVEAYAVVKEGGLGINLPKNHVGMIFAFNKDGSVAWYMGEWISDTTDGVLIDTSTVDSWGKPIDEYIFMYCPLTDSFWEDYYEKIVDAWDKQLTFDDFSFIPRENMRFFKYDGVTKPLSQKITTASFKKTYKVSALKKKSVTFSLKAKAIGAQYFGYSVDVPKKLEKYITVSYDGKVTLKKGAKKGTYKIKITAYGSGAYKDATKTISIKVK